jgi:radical SAM superfamily enzyme YgiQ (UPF0313 family)
LTTYSLKKELYSPGDIPFGISFIATILKQAGHNVKLIVVTPTTPLNEELQTLIDDFKPDLFCLTAVSTQMPIIKKVGEVVRQIDDKVFIILGGSHPTLNPEEVIAYDFIDAVCVGEGEKAAIELTRQLESGGSSPTGIANLWIKNRQTGDVEKNSRLPFFTDLDSLPFIDREMWEPFISNKKNVLYTVLAGRGCPNRCTYCSNHALARITNGRYVRFRSPENIIEEIKALIGRDPNVETIFLETETLGANLKYTYQLLEQLTDFNNSLKKPLKFGTNLALNRQIKNNRQLLQAFKDAGLDFFRIGLESGSEKVRREVLRRPKYYNDDLIEFCRLAREFGVKYTINLLIGLPGETHEDFQETIDVTRKCRPTYGVSVSIFFPYPGTRLFEVCKEQDLLSSDFRTAISERTGTVLNLPGFSPWQIKKEFILFYYKVHKGYKPWSDIAATTLRNIVDAYPPVKRFISKIVHTFSMLSTKG